MYFGIWLSLSLIENLSQTSFALSKSLLRIKLFTTVLIDCSKSPPHNSCICLIVTLGFSIWYFSGCSIKTVLICINICFFSCSSVNENLVFGFFSILFLASLSIISFAISASNVPLAIFVIIKAISVGTSFLILSKTIFWFIFNILFPILLFTAPT